MFRDPYVFKALLRGPVPFLKLVSGNDIGVLGIPIRLKTFFGESYPFKRLFEGFVSFSSSFLGIPILFVKACLRDPYPFC